MVAGYTRLMGNSSNPLQGLITTAAQQQQLFKIAQMPRHPPEVLQRFPSMQKYDDDMQTWLKGLVFNLQQSGVGS